MFRLLVPLSVSISIAASCLAQTPPTTAQPKAPTATVPAAAPGAVRPIPPPGIEVPAADRAEIEAGLNELAGKIELLRKSKDAADLPNVEIYHKAVDWALRYNEIFDTKQIATAKDLVKQGLERARALDKGEKPWDKEEGLVVRGYRSKLDGSVQPYGLVFTPAATETSKVPFGWPLHFWCHGRAEKLSELAFIAERQKVPGEFTPEGAILCHLYGRFCNANKFAGEVDLFEVLEDIKKHYPIDPERLVVRGFSMGGAACWQFATHYSGMWAAAAPGAGFAETAEFFKVFAPGKEAPPAWEQTLWRWYDCTTMAANLANTSTIAYSGELDGQKQAADIMIKYAEKQGITFPHIIGPQTPHKYHADSKPKINELVDAAVKKGNVTPKEVRLVTYTLIYPRVAWVRIESMEKQWERAEVNAKWEGKKIEVKTTNVAALNLTPWSDDMPTGPETITVDGAEFTRKGGMTRLTLDKIDGKWKQVGQSAITKSGAVESTDSARVMGNPALRKVPATCGPIDHAFMSPFIFVRPTGKALNDTVGAWTKAEFDHAVEAWRRVFRGDVRVVDDTKLSQADITGSNLILWGDPSSNAVLKQVLPNLPLKWDATNVELRGQKLDAAHHVPIMIYPNALSKGKYVVLNSGFTFREFAALNNSDQTPKLPDWALVDLRTPPGPKWPGKIVDAGFFDETWK